MECTQKQQAGPIIELSPPAEIRIVDRSKQIAAYDKKSAELRRHLASEEAIQKLERRRDLGLTAVQRMSFIR